MLSPPYQHGPACSRFTSPLRSTPTVHLVCAPRTCATHTSPPHTVQDGLKQPEAGASSSDEELSEAETVVQSVDAGGKGKKDSPLAVFFEVATLIFLAEWGDRWAVRGWVGGWVGG